MTMAPVDLDDITRRADRALRTAFPDGAVSRIEPLQGGASSLTYLAAVDGPAGVPTEAVAKVAPPGLEPVRNRDVLRQARLLAVLGDRDGVAVPAVFGSDAGDPPQRPPLFVMSYVPGESYEPLRAEAGSTGPDDTELRARVDAAVSMLAALQRPELADRFPGEPRVTLDDEIGKWARALSTVDPDWIPGAADCEKALRAARPAEMSPVVLHGDWRLGNMQCVGGEVRAVIDWEIWSIGDPRLDLAWMCMMLHPQHPGVISQRSGVPTVEEVVAGYEAAAGVTVGDFGWFLALTAYKQSATTALICKNAAKRGQVGPMHERRMGMLVDLQRWALELLG